MSLSYKNNMRLNQIINKNNEMRNNIYESVNNIDFLLKEYFKEQRRNKLDKDNNDEKIDLSEIDNLSFSEQIELYRESIMELKKESQEVKMNRIEIENINKEINELKLKLSNEKKINNSLEKMNKNYSKIINNIDIETANLKQDEKEFQLKTLTEDFHNLKEEYKNSINIIKKQVKSIMILEDNCKFIGENIYFYKNKENNKNNEEKEDFEEIKKMAEDVQSLKENLEDKYEYKIKKQQNEINKLKEFNKVLLEIIEEQNNKNKLDMINKGKSNHHHELNFFGDDE
jgi:hypothetical protein